MLVALRGPVGSGKSTAAGYLASSLGFKRIVFAKPLKDMLRAVGLTDRELDGDLKERPCDVLMGKTPRFALQRLGTEFGRDTIHPDLWISLWLREAKPLLDEGRRVVVDDLRFPNEAALVHRLGGKIIRIDPPIKSSDEHISERNELPHDVAIFNEGVSLDDFQARIDGALALLGAR